jgi:hypothetical protein
MLKKPNPPVVLMPSCNAAWLANATARMAGNRCRGHRKKRGVIDSKARARPVHTRWA